jgi:pSer/pThr/pTyr-binding forkhead associated (FHA) protein
LSRKSGPIQRVRKLRDGDRINAAIDAALAGLRDANEYVLRFARPAELGAFMEEWQVIERQLGEIGDEVTIWNPEDYQDR